MLDHLETAAGLEPTAPSAPEAPPVEWELTEPEQVSAPESAPAEPTAEQSEPRVGETNEEIAYKTATQRYQEAARMVEEAERLKAEVAAKEQDERWKQINELYDLVQNDERIAQNLDGLYSNVMQRNAAARLESELRDVREQLAQLQQGSLESEAQKAITTFAGWYAEQHPTATPEEVQAFTAKFVDDFNENGPEALPENGRDVVERMQFHYWRTTGKTESQQQIEHVRESTQAQVLETVARARAKAPVTPSNVEPPEWTPPPDRDSEMTSSLQAALDDPTITEADFTGRLD